jgi:hypothetical protein
MRTFQPIAERTKRKQRRPPWIAPPALRRVAWLIATTVILLQLILLFRLLYYPFDVQNHLAYGYAHIGRGWHLEFALLMLQFCCMPIIGARPPSPKKKHIADPMLSIKPR